jgi:multiple sugar transport system permease protein
MIITTRSERIISNTLVYLSLAVLSFIAVFPLFFTLSSSLKTAPDLMRNPAGLLPIKISFGYYLTLLQRFNIGLYMRNSLIVSTLSVVISTGLSAFAAYAIVRFYGSRGRIIVRGLILTYMFPRIVLVIPFYVILANLGLANTLTGLVIAYLSFTVPFSMYLLIGFFTAVPIEIEESAVIDGASRFQVFRLIALPLTASGIVASRFETGGDSGLGRDAGRVGHGRDTLANSILHNPEAYRRRHVCGRSERVMLSASSDITMAATTLWVHMVLRYLESFTRN